MGHHRKKQGFTIVELLIVVIVIAILVTISAVSYNNVTKSSHNDQIKTGVKMYYEAIKAYKLSKGVYPQTQREVDGQWIAMTCLGKGYKNQACGKVTDVDVFEDALFNSQLQSFLRTNTTSISNVTLPVPGETYIGAVYGIDRVSTSSTDYGRVIEYALYGEDADCGIKGAYSYSNSAHATACEIVFEEVTF